MTLTQFILVIFALFAIVCGAYIIWTSAKKKKNTEPLAQEPALYEKDGLPILSRHERPVAENATFKAEITPDNPTGTVILNADNTELNADSHVQSLKTHEQSPNPPVTMTYAAKPEPYQMPAEGDDAFSTLATATETISPTIQTFDEKQLTDEHFSQKSPVLDEHLALQQAREQDSPLNNAVQNINISIFPNGQFDRIAGHDLLKLVDKYGIKYGAMNMFHRYEQKDGTGILWFSMMMVTDTDILPFDLNTLPTQSMRGLVLFLSLPHPKAVQGFDSMISTAGLLAHDLSCSVYTETGEPLSKENIQRMRDIAVNFGKD